MILENNGRKIIIGGNISEEIEVPDKEIEDPKEILYNICQTISEGGYNPISQLVGYIVSEDPTHISNYKNARTLIGRIDRDDLLEDMVQTYIGSLENQFGKKEIQENDD